MKTCVALLALLLLCGAALRTNAVEVWVDLTTGEVVFEEPAQPVLWPDGSGYCTTSLDARYIAHTDRYEVWEHIAYPRDFGYKKSITTTVSIYDLVEAAQAIHSAGVWHNNEDCGTVTHDFSHQIVKPLLAAVREQNRGSMTSRLWGLVLEMQCQTPNDVRFGDEIHTCRDGNEMMQIAQGRISQIHAIRADAEKRFQ